MNDRDKILGLMGLAARAGKVISGSDAVAAEIRSGETGEIMIIFAEDAADNTKKKTAALCVLTGKRARMYCYADAASLGKAIGKSDRAIAAITDGGFSAGLAQMLEGFEYKEENT